MTARRGKEGSHAGQSAGREAGAVILSSNSQSTGREAGAVILSSNSHLICTIEEIPLRQAIERVSGKALKLDAGCGMCQDRGIFISIISLYRVTSLT